MPAAEAKTHFGELLDRAQREPVTISKKGRPVAVMMSIHDYEEVQRLKLAHLRREVHAGLDELDAGQGLDGADFMAVLIAEDC